MSSEFTVPPLPKVDRLAAIRAAKAAIQGGSHALPPRPSLAQLPRQIVSTNIHQPATPMSSSTGGSSSGGIGGASGSGGGSVGGRK
jgi:hypothetical protein